MAIDLPTNRITVRVVASGGLPVKDKGSAGATPMTDVDTATYGAVPVTLVTSASIGATPITLYNADGSLYSSNH